MTSRYEEPNLTPRERAEAVVQRFAQVDHLPDGALDALELTWMIERAVLAAQNGLPGVELLRVEPGDAIIFTVPTPISRQECVQVEEAWLKRTAGIPQFEDTPLIIVAGGATVSVLRGHANKAQAEAAQVDLTRMTTEMVEAIGRQRLREQHPELAAEMERQV